MNTFRNLMTSFLLVLSAGMAGAQIGPKIGVLNIDSKGITFDPEQCGNMVRIELSKLNRFDVIDKYDVKDLMERNNKTVENCYGTTCLSEAGKILKADKMLAGSIERYGDKLIITFRLVDVASSTTEKSQVNEFLNIQPSLQDMISNTLKKMWSLPVDTAVLAILSQENTYESTVNNPGVQRLSLDGPRMGITFVSGEAYKRITASKEFGGYEAFPVMTQFGYQFEKQYLNAGNLQALVEFLPMVIGIDQGMFIPSFTFLQGFRNNKTGWELAFGPSLGFAKTLRGYYFNEGPGADKQWHPEEDWNLSADRNGILNPNKIFENLDRRGNVKFNSGFVIACGKTFKSGKVNFPVNIYLVPDIKGNWRIGASFGFNAKNNH